MLDLDALDSTLRLSWLNAEIVVVRMKPVPRRRAAVRHECGRLVFLILPEASGR